MTKPDKSDLLMSDKSDKSNIYNKYVYIYYHSKPSVIDKTQKKPEINNNQIHRVCNFMFSLVKIF